MTAVVAIGLAAGIAQALAYVIYATQVVRAETRPNGMTWLMWSYGSLVFFAIEAHLGAPASVLVLPGVCTLSSIGVALYAFGRGVRIPADRQDWAVLSLDVALMLGYVLVVIGIGSDGSQAEAAGLVFVALAGATSVTSSLPILRTTYLEPANERPLAWFVWASAYGLLGLAAMAEGLPWPYLVYPILSQVISMVIGVLAMEDAESTPSAAAASGGVLRAGTTP